MEEFGENLDGLHAGIKSIFPEQLWDMYISYANHYVYGSFAQNQYTIYNNYVFGLCMLAFLILISLSFVKSRFGGGFCALLLALPFVMFHNLFDFIVSLPKHDSPVCYDWHTPIISMAKGIGKGTFYDHIITVISTWEIKDLSLLFLTLRLLLLFFTLVFATTYILSNALDISIEMHLLNTAVIFCSSHFFYPSVVIILRELGAYAATILVAGPFFPVIYILLVLLLILIKIVLWIIFPRKEKRRYNTTHIYGYS